MKNIFKGSWLLMGAFVLIAGLAGCAGSGEKTGVYVDDSVITSTVKSQMVVEKGIHSTDISVKTTKGVVTLTGTVATKDESNKAAELARGVKGVTSVENNIVVK